MRGRADRRGRRRQDLRAAARARRAHPHGRDGPRRGDAGRRMITLAQAVPKINTGDTAWILVPTALVLMMTPALGLFYAGLVRAKSTLNTFMMSNPAIAVGQGPWAAVGYSLAFDGSGSFIGGLHNAFLNDVTFAPNNVATTIPHLLFFAFQATFCIITVAPISGALAARERW